MRRRSPRDTAAAIAYVKFALARIDSADVLLQARAADAVADIRCSAATAASAAARIGDSSDSRRLASHKGRKREVFETALAQQQR